MVDYFKLINKYFDQQYEVYREYIIHVTLVTNKALQIARRLELDPSSLEFIEEAAMLHDIGYCRTKDPDWGVFGDLPDIAHILGGEEILKEEGFPRHANVALTHTGVGIFKEDIEDNKLPLPVRDYIPETLEEKIVSYSDLFFSKNPETLWQEKFLDEVRRDIAKLGERHRDVLEEWVELFE